MLAITAAAGPAFPQGYPSKPVRIVTAAAGGGSDVATRLIAPPLAALLGEQVVVDNRGVLASDIAAKAPPDGYTMLLTTGSFTGNIVLYKKLPYDGVRDFAPITQIARSYGLVLVVNPSVPAESVKDLIALAKARPGKLTYGSSGVGNITHLVPELFNTLAGVQIQHVPYKGSGPALTDVLGRQIDMTWVSTVFVQPFIKDGRVRPLGLTGEERSPVLPNIPTFRELGLTDLVMTGWYGLWFPAKTPPARVSRIQSELKRAVATPEMKARLDDLGLVAVASTPAEFAKFLQDDIALQTRIVKRAGIPQQ
jgi:tripartite-type tricarboxylate transporter receptor subunit TctC